MVQKEIKDDPSEIEKEAAAKCTIGCGRSSFILGPRASVFRAKHEIIFDFNLAMGGAHGEDAHRLLCSRCLASVCKLRS